MKRAGSKTKIKKAGIFSASLLSVAAIVGIYAPIVKTHAEDNQNVNVSVGINSEISLTVSTGTLNFAFTPTDTSAFDSKPIVATVNTNSSGGYELYFSSSDENSALTSLTSSTTIASDFSGTVTSSTMAVNKWGYSLDNTNFSKIPALSNQVAIKNIDHFPTSNEKNTTVNIGVKINADLPSGMYSKTVKFTAVAHETPTPTMQSFECSMLANVGDGAILEDYRDGNKYSVKKLADGRCWMTENLRIAGKEISDEDSDMAANTSFVIPASNINGFYTTYDVSRKAVYVDSTYGGYYTWQVATADAATPTMTSGEVNYSICPKGWKMPSWTEVQTMSSQYDSNSIINGDPHFVLSGVIFRDRIEHADYEGWYFTSTASTEEFSPSTPGVETFFLSTDTIIPIDLNSRGIGNAIRCVTRN